MNGLPFVSWRNFIRHLHRYRVLLVALVLITTTLTMVLAVVLGLREGLHEKASRYFAGDIVVLGFTGEGASLIEEPESLFPSIKALGKRRLNSEAFSRRSSYYEANQIDVFFSGYWTKQRRLVGVEWSLERPVLQDFDFVEGGVPEKGDESAVLISSATANLLHIAAGDTLLISISTERGSTNTVELFVRGIYAESSFFGYTSYLHRRTLNRLKNVPEETVNEIGVYLTDPFKDSEDSAIMVEDLLQNSYPTFGVVENRHEYNAAAARDRSKRHYGVVTVSAQLDEINDLISAISIIAGVTIVMFLGITIVGVSNTFTMIVWERKREIGTLRALGMQRKRAIVSFLMESGFLGIGGAGIGIFMGIIGLELIRRFVVFPQNFVTSLFLTQGKLEWVLPELGIVLIVTLIALSCVFGSLRAALRSGKMHPSEVLSGHE